MLFSLTKNDFKAKYAGSALGALWAFICPVITIFIYWFVFQVAFQNGPVGNVPYVLWLVSGIVPWFFISEGWGAATGALVDYSYLVKKVVFPVEKLPLIRILSAFFVHLFFIALTFIISVCYGFGTSLSVLQVIYYGFAAFMLVYALGTMTSVLCAFTKDVSNIVGVFVQFGFWLTPIFWNIDQIPKNLVFIFKLNPVYYITEGYRDAFVYGTWFFEKPWLTAYFWVLTTVILVLGKILFKRLRPHLADLL